MSHKKDEGKLRYDRIDPYFLESIAKVLTHGVKKYKDDCDKWMETPNALNRYYAALMRHLVEWKKGNFIDKESKLNVLSHVAFNVMALIYHERKLHERIQQKMQLRLRNKNKKLSSNPEEKKGE